MQHDRRKNDAGKEIVKEAIKEWLDDAFMRFGKWTATGITIWIFIAVINLLMALHHNTLEHILALGSTPPLNPKEIP